MNKELEKELQKAEKEIPKIAVMKAQREYQEKLKKKENKSA